MRTIGAHAARLTLALALFAAFPAAAGAQSLVGFEGPTRTIGGVLDASSAHCDIARHDRSDAAASRAPRTRPV